MSNKIKELSQTLDGIEGIVNRLEYYKENYYLKYERDPQKLMEIFECSELTTTLKVPIEIYHRFFEPSGLSESDQVAFFNWWVDFLAEYSRFCFPAYKKEIDNIARVRSSKKYLQKELNKIEAFERRVDELYDEGKISFGDTPSGPYADELIYLKLTQGYYEFKDIEEFEYKVQDAAKVKAKYLLSKDYINSLLSDEVTSASQEFHHLFQSTDKAKACVEKLKEHYTGKKPKEMALLVFALAELNFISDIYNLNIKSLFRIFQREFELKGEYRSLTKAVNKLKDPDSHEESSIQTHKVTIEKLLHNNTKK